MSSIYQQILDSELVKHALEQRAERYLAAAQAQAHASGRTIMGDHLRLEYSVRPGDKAKYGERRPQYAVVADLSEKDHEVDSRHATATPYQVLRRAKRG